MAVPRDIWLQSPLYAMITERLTELRLSPEDAETLRRFPIMRMCRERGATDYVAMLVPFGDPATAVQRQDGVLTSWASDASGGFSAWDLTLLRHLNPYVSVVSKLSQRHLITSNVVEAYLGKGVGHRVLEGQIRLGDVDPIPAVIWYSDLRESTAMAEALAPHDFLATVNSYFACTAGAVLDAGGEVLRFIGDALPAVFPITTSQSPQQAAKLAMAAATDARRRLEALNAERQQAGGRSLDLGLGLHLGELLYGNIGADARREFSVIGRAANEVARLESLTKDIGEPVLVSSAFAQAVPVEWCELGVHGAKGVAGGLEVFAPR